MANVESSFFDMSRLETLSDQETAIHRLDPRTKILATLVFIVAVVSFDRYAITGLIPFVLYPVVLLSVGNLPADYLLKKILLAAPFAFFVGILNPFLDRQILVQLGPIGISGGVVSFASIMLRFVLTVSSALILVATTGFNAICMALGSMGVPRTLVVQLLFLYRYIFVLTDEAGRMVRARALRSFGGKGLGMKVYGYMAGQLLLRTLDRAQRIHLAMLCRGFDGEIRLMRPLKMRPGDVLFLAGWCGAFLLMRLVDIPNVIGRVLTGLMP